MKVALDLHDFSVVNNRMGLLLKLKEVFPNFKVSLFTVPCDVKSDWGQYQVRDKSLEEIKKHLDWIQIIPHGLYHTDSKEMKNMSYDEFKNIVVNMIKQAFWIDRLPYEHGFCSPHWNQSEGVTKALDDMGWWGAVKREAKETPNRFYRYNYLLNEPFLEAKEEVLKLHGHVYGTKNDIGLCFNNLLKLPKDTEWHYVTDFIETK